MLDYFGKSSAAAALNKGLYILVDRATGRLLSGGNEENFGKT